MNGGGDWVTMRFTAALATEGDEVPYMVGAKTVNG